MFDEDPMARDDLIATLLFDLSSLTIGKKETKVFTINPEVKATRKCRKIPLRHFNAFWIRTDL